MESNNIRLEQAEERFHVIKDRNFKIIQPKKKKKKRNKKE